MSKLSRRIHTCMESYTCSRVVMKYIISTLTPMNADVCYLGSRCKTCEVYLWHIEKRQVTGVREHNA